MTGSCLKSQLVHQQRRAGRRAQSLPQRQPEQHRIGTDAGRPIQRRRRRCAGSADGADGPARLATGRRPGGRPRHPQRRLDPDRHRRRRRLEALRAQLGHRRQVGGLAGERRAARQGLGRRGAPGRERADGRAAPRSPTSRPARPTPSTAGSDVPTTSGGTWALGGDTPRCTRRSTAPAPTAWPPSTSPPAPRTSPGARPSGTASTAPHVPRRHRGARPSTTRSRPAAPSAPSPATPIDAVRRRPRLHGLGGRRGRRRRDLVGHPATSSGVDAAHFYARVGDDYFDLGPGTSGTLTCRARTRRTSSATRSSEGDPAALMRWDAEDGLAVVYESPPGRRVPRSTALRWRRADGHRAHRERRRAGDGRPLKVAT